jgi:leader peptidase (prepilin peptidase)/N-methyltransferase
LSVDAIILVLAAAFGAMFGSFLNVVVHRLPEGKSLWWPGSACPKCGAAIRWFDNVPILSWLLLLGRCRGCRSPISPRYPLVETLTAALVAALAVLWLADRNPREWAAFAVSVPLVGALIAASFIDFAHQIIPDRITLPGMVAAPVLSLLAPRLAAAEPVRTVFENLSPPGAALLTSLLGIATGAGSIWLVRAVGTIVFRKEAMGFGDVKFMGMIGGFIGPVGVLLAILIACFVGAVVGGAGWLFTRKNTIPFGPWLAAGTLAVLFLRTEVVHFLTVTWPSLLH